MKGIPVEWEIKPLSLTREQTRLWEALEPEPFVLSTPFSRVGSGREHGGVKRNRNAGCGQQHHGHIPHSPAAKDFNTAGKTFQKCLTTLMTQPRIVAIECLLKTEQKKKKVKTDFQKKASALFFAATSIYSSEPTNRQCSLGTEGFVTWSRSREGKHPTGRPALTSFRPCPCRRPRTAPRCRWPFKGGVAELKGDYVAPWLHF